MKTKYVIIEEFFRGDFKTADIKKVSKYTDRVLFNRASRYLEVFTKLVYKINQQEDELNRIPSKLEEIEYIIDYLETRIIYGMEDEDKNDFMEYLLERFKPMMRKERLKELLKK